MSTLNNVIQLGFDPQDNRLWWCDMHLWQTQTEDGEEEPDTVKRPTEIRAFRNIYRQSRLMQKRGVLINLSPLHKQIMVLEYSAMTCEPKPDNVYNWIAARMKGIPPFQVKNILDECSLVVLLREALSMPALVMEWPAEKVAKRRAA